MRVDVKVHKTRRDVVLKRLKNGDEVMTCYVSQHEMDIIMNQLISKQNEHGTD